MHCFPTYLVQGGIVGVMVHVDRIVVGPVVRAEEGVSSLVAVVPVASVRHIAVEYDRITWRTIHKSRIQAKTKSDII